MAKSILDSGNQASVVDVECTMTNGLPNIVIVGIANKAVEESKERIRSSFASAKLELPRKRITINLAPADIPKEGTGFDMPIAISILAASNQVKLVPPKTAYVGELGLDGSVRTVRGIIGKLLAGRKLGFKTFYVPEGNMKQALLVPDITLVGVSQIRDVYLDLTQASPLARIDTGKGSALKISTKHIYDFKEIVGQVRAKRALEIAAAGGHNILLNGPPGTGKSMLAKAMPSILPPMEIEEILEVTHLHSLANKNYEEIIVERPFRSPHHSSSDISIIGGGQYPRPGEISLAHQGILFFDEFPEFGRMTIEALRQPLEDRIITVARSKDNITFPANFIFIATSNPCPCGFWGTDKPCICLPHHITNYHRKLSGPILDRIDLYVDVDQVKHSSLLGGTEQEESSRDIRSRVLRARNLQLKRLQDPLKTNAGLDNRGIRRSIRLTETAGELLNQAAERLQISPRSYMRIIKVAQTIADLADSEVVDAIHISEALQYRRQTEI